MLARNHNKVIDSTDSVTLVLPKVSNRQQCRGRIGDCCSLEARRRVVDAELGVQRRLSWLTA